VTTALPVINETAAYDRLLALLIKPWMPVERSSMRMRLAGLWIYFCHTALL
jgi:hypothetical protein